MTEMWFLNYDFENQFEKVLFADPTSMHMNMDI